MRGERDANLINCNFRGNATPSTPSTASTTVRQNPLTYQRMHSNDSDKDGGNGSGSGAGRVSDWLDSPSVHTSQKNLNFPSKFRKSSSPARKWPNGSPGRNHHHLAPHNKFVTMPSNQYALAGSAKRNHQNDARRSSAAGLAHQRPPLPPNNIGKRSQSLDGLLDTANDTCTSNSTEGASDDTPNTTTTTADNQTNSDTTDSLTNQSTINRRSRSLEDLLDERDEIHSNYDSHSKSMDSSIDAISIRTEPSTELIKDDDVTGNSEAIDKTDASSIGSASSLNPSQAEKPCDCETITVANTVPQTNETDSSVASAIIDDDRASNLTAYSRQGSTTSKDSDNKKKTFLNRYVKKVKSFMKK